MKPFEFTAADIASYESSISEAEKDIDYVVRDRYVTIGARIRQNVVKPFCQKFNLTFDTGMGQWSFCYTKGPYAGKCWFVGEDRRVCPDKPEGPEGDDDRCWPEITEEEKAIKRLLDTFDYKGNAVGLWVGDYPDKNGL